jgi:broad specificity phosphatase PhoE
MLIYLVRHGQSVWNAEERHQGWQDVPLSPLGELQAARAGQRLKGKTFDYYFVSPIYRCYQTAEIMLHEMGVPAENLQKLEGLKEARLSARQEGMFTKDMVKSWTDEQKRRFKEDYTFKFEDGESVQETIERTKAVFHEISMLSEEPPAPPPDEANEPASASDPQMTRDVRTDKEQPKIQPKTALIVAHRINIQLFVLATLDALDTVARYQTNIDRLEISNCALSALEVNIKGNEPLYRLLFANDVTHLAGLKPPEQPTK